MLEPGACPARAAPPEARRRRPPRRSIGTRRHARARRRPEAGVRRAEPAGSAGRSTRARLRWPRATDSARGPGSSELDQLRGGGRIGQVAQPQRQLGSRAGRPRRGRLPPPRSGAGHTRTPRIRPITRNAAQPLEARPGAGPMQPRDDCRATPFPIGGSDGCVECRPGGRGGIVGAGRRVGFPRTARNFRVGLVTGRRPLRAGGPGAPPSGSRSGRGARRVATLPRGVRSRKPRWIRNGSTTSSSVPLSSPTAAASVSSPTGPPSNFSRSAVR